MLSVLRKSAVLSWSSISVEHANSQKSRFAPEAIKKAILMEVGCAIVNSKIDWVVKSKNAITTIITDKPEIILLLSLLNDRYFVFNLELLFQLSLRT